MKIEIIYPSTNEIIETYSVPYLSMFDFEQWKNEDEIIIHLNCFLDKVTNLDSMDSETNEPISNPREVDFYLPEPIKKQVFSEFETLQTDTEIFHDQLEYQVSTQLKSSTILTAVVTEILQNHNHHLDYQVRISDE